MNSYLVTRIFMYVLVSRFKLSLISVFMFEGMVVLPVICIGVYYFSEILQYYVVCDSTIESPYKEVSHQFIVLKITCTKGHF